MKALDVDLPGFRRWRLPVVLQSERTECGLACIAMVACAYGRKLDLPTLRRSCDHGARGSTLTDLARAAERLGLLSRAVRLSMDDLAKLRLPAILHWQMNHFVVLSKVERRRIHIIDPASGHQCLKMTEADRLFTGVAMELQPGPDFCTGDERSTIGFRQMIGDIRWMLPMIFSVSVLLLASQLLALAPSIAAQVLIDEVMLGEDRRWLNRAGAGLAIVMVLVIGLDAIRGWIQLHAGTRLAIDSTTRLIAHVVRIPVRFLERRHLGDVLSRLSSLTPIREALVNDVARLVSDTALLVVTLTLMLLYSGVLTVVSVISLAATLIVLAATLPRARQLSEDLLNHRAAEETSLVETFRGFECVRHLGLEAVRHRHWHDCFLDSISSVVRQGKLSIIRSSLVAAINTADQVAFLVIGIGGVMSDTTTVGVMFAFFSLRSKFAIAAAGITDTAQRFALLKVHGDRLAELVSEPSERRDAPDGLREPVLGRIETKQLTYCYSDRRPLINGFDCRIEPGTNAVITGPSGCGKTTLLKLLAGYFEPDHGTVLLDDIDVSLWDRDHLRREIGFVGQGDSLFRGSIAQNISRFDPVADIRRVREAAIIAGVWNDISDLPMSIHTEIDDCGTSMSSGQIQRLLIARALYHRPKVLFLDEATSHLDVATEVKVLESISKLQVTVISVAHRPGAIRSAGQIIKLAKPVSNCDR